VHWLWTTQHAALCHVHICRTLLQMRVYRWQSAKAVLNVQRLRTSTQRLQQLASGGVMNSTALHEFPAPPVCMGVLYLQ
jgi:hypothetical protein